MGTPVKIATVMAALAAFLPASASAAYPGSNGKIVFEFANQIESMNPDGSGLVDLTLDNTHPVEPAVSPDGQKIRIRAMPGNPATAADEADVAVRLNVRDVRCGPQVLPELCGEGNTAGGDDYSGSLRIRIAARITDRYHLPAPGGRSSGTTAEYVPLDSYDPSCIESPLDTTVGSTCLVQTSIEALYPGAIQEGLRANFELGQVEVYDFGHDANGDDGPPAQVFLRRGLFVP